MVYQGNQIDYNNLNNELKFKVDKAEGLESQVQALTPKVDNSWQKGAYNDTNIANLGNSSVYKAFIFNDWDDDNSKLDSLYINIPVGNGFSGLIKLTLTSNYNFGNAMGGAEIVYNVAKVGEEVFLNTMIINSISQHFATCFYVKPLVSAASRLYIPITKAPTTRNAINIKVEIFSTLAIFDVVNNIEIARDPLISQPHPWTPQTSSFAILDKENTFTQMLVSTNQYPFIMKSLGQPSYTFHTNNNRVYLAPSTSINGVDWNWGKATEFWNNGDVYVKGRLLVEGVDLKQSVSNGKAQVASAITGKGVQTASDATFETMANNIRAIPTGGSASGNTLSSQSTATFTYKNGGTVTLPYVDIANLGFIPSAVLLSCSTGGGNMTTSTYSKSPDVLGYTDTVKIALQNGSLYSNSPNHNLTPHTITNGLRIPVTSPSGNYVWTAYK